MKPLLQRLAGVVVLLALLVLSSVPTFSQDSATVVQVSPRVGASIDRAERDEFRLFQSYEGFDSAVVCRTRDNKYFLFISRTSGGGISRDTTLEPSEGYLLMLGERINHFEGLLSGDYRMGTEPARLLVLDKTISLSLPTASSLPSLPRPAASSLPSSPQATAAVSQGISESSLPWADRPVPAGMLEDPTWSIGARLSSFDPDLTGLNAFFESVEKKYRDQQIEIGRHKTSYTTGPLFWVGLKFRPSAEVAITLGAGISTSDDFNSKAFVLQGMYYPGLLRSGIFRPYVGGGIHSHHVELIQPYSAPLPRGGTLEGVEVKGGALGVILGGGFDLDWNVILIGFDADYSFLSRIDVSSSTGESAGVKLSGLMLGAHLYFAF